MAVIFDAINERGTTATEPYKFNLNLQGSIAIRFKMVAGITQNVRILRLAARLDINLEANSNRVFVWFQSPTNGSGALVFRSDQSGFAGSMNDGAWHNLVVSKGATGIQVYLDNRAANFFATTELTSGQSSFQIGDGETGRNPNVRMRDVCVWNLALSSTEASTYHFGTVPQQANLVGWWKLNETSGLSGADSSTGAARPMTMTAGTTWAVDSPSPSVSPSASRSPSASVSASISPSASQSPSASSSPSRSPSSSFSPSQPPFGAILKRYSSGSWVKAKLMVYLE